MICKPCARNGPTESGAPRGIRIPDPQVRRVEGRAGRTSRPRRVRRLPVAVDRAFRCVLFPTPPSVPSLGRLLTHGPPARSAAELCPAKHHPNRAVTLAGVRADPSLHPSTRRRIQSKKVRSARRPPADPAGRRRLPVRPRPHPLRVGEVDEAVAVDARWSTRQRARRSRACACSPTMPMGRRQCNNRPLRRGGPAP